MHKKTNWLLLALWAVGLLSALLLYGQRQLSQFDPNGELLHRTTAPDFDATLVEFLKNQNIKAGSVIHVGTQSRCYCDTLTTPHQTQLLALIVLDKQAQLRYLGPYATGYGCFTGKNLVEQVVSYTTQLPYNGAVINADASGCFC